MGVLSLIVVNLNFVRYPLYFSFANIYLNLIYIPLIKCLCPYCVLIFIRVVALFVFENPRLSPTSAKKEEAKENVDKQKSTRAFDTNVVFISVLPRLFDSLIQDPRGPASIHWGQDAYLWVVNRFNTFLSELDGKW